MRTDMIAVGVSNWRQEHSPAHQESIKVESRAAVSQAPDRARPSKPCSLSCRLISMMKLSEHVADEIAEFLRAKQVERHVHAARVDRYSDEGSRAR